MTGGAPHTHVGVAQHLYDLFCSVVHRSVDASDVRYVVARGVLAGILCVTVVAVTRGLVT